MSDFLLLALDAPLMSFGGVAVDNLGVTERFPGQSLLTGLLGNALGLRHQDTAALERLQARIQYGVRVDAPGHRLLDFQTVDLGQAHLVDTGWTTRGAPEGRAGASSTATHIRQREYLADAAVWVALTLEPAEEAPDLEALAEALRRPARPLFIGRKCCLPSRPIPEALVQADSLEDALLKARWLRDPERSDRQVTVWLPAEGPDTQGDAQPVRDRRDWETQLHQGQRFVRRRLVGVPHARG